MLLSSQRPTDRLVQIGFSTTAASLSNTNRYLNFNRVVPSDDVQIEVDNCTFKTTQWQQQNNSNKIKQKHNQAKIYSWKPGKQQITNIYQVLTTYNVLRKGKEKLQNWGYQKRYSESVNWRTTGQKIRLLSIINNIKQLTYIYHIMIRHEHNW